MCLAVKAVTTVLLGSTGAKSAPHGHAAHDIGVHVDGEGLDAGVLRQHRQNEAQAVAVHAVGHPHRRRPLHSAREMVVDRE